MSQSYDGMVEAVTEHMINQNYPAGTKVLCISSVDSPLSIGEVYTVLDQTAIGIVVTKYPIQSFAKSRFTNYDSIFADQFYAECIEASTPKPQHIAMKDDSSKPTFDLLPVDALAEIQKVLDFGAEKYSPWNWAKGFLWLRLWNATIRHLFAWVTGEDKDKETGISHLAHAGCCILFLLSHELRGLGKDDRRKVS